MGNQEQAYKINLSKYHYTRDDTWSCTLKESFASMDSLLWYTVDMYLQLESGITWLLDITEDAFFFEWMAYYTVQECFLDRCYHLVAALFTLVSHSYKGIHIFLLFLVMK